MSTPPRMVIQQSMATFFYHAFASIQPANHSDFFNTHSPLHQQSGTVPCEVREVSELVLNLPSKLGCFGVFSSTEECGKARWVKGFMLLTSKLTRQRSGGCNDALPGGGSTPHAATQVQPPEVETTRPPRWDCNADAMPSVQRRVGCKSHFYLIRGVSFGVLQVHHRHRRMLDCYRQKVSGCRTARMAIYGANLGPISVPQCSKCSESARKGSVSCHPGPGPAKLYENKSGPSRVFNSLAHVFDPVGIPLDRSVSR